MLGLGLLGLVAASAGCRIDQQDIETWKGTVKGPGKMVAVVLAPKYEMELRSAAALALVDMERSDVDGVAELQQALARLDAKTRAALIDGLAPGLIALMQGDGEPPKPGEPPPARQIRAKDSAFALIPEAAPETRQALTEAVVRWYTVDFAGRNLSGAYSAEQVMRGLGSEAAKLLVDALHARLPQRALVKLAELIGQLGDAQTKKRAADKLVKIEQEMRSAEFLEWLKGQIRDQFEASGEKPDDERVLKAAILNQAKFIDEGAIPAMKHLASEPQVADRLLAIAARKEAVLAARRTRALQALEGNAREEHLDTLLSLALDPEAPASVRDYAFDRVGDVRSKRAIEPMWPLVADADNQRLRWRAGELVLQIGGNAVLSEFFAKLPGGRETAYEPEELEGYASRMGQMTPPPTEVAAAQLASPDWFDRVIALNYFQRKGDEDDVPRMRRLLSDTAPVTGKGWDDDETVGKVAKQAIAGLRERLGHGKADAAGG
jgi:hypothetical protein